jgi:uncharacterized protein
LLRVVLGEPGQLEIWPKITSAVSSELIRIECLRTIDRARIRSGLTDSEVAESRAVVQEAISGFTLVRVDSAVLERAAQPFPTSLGTLDAIHLASALLSRQAFDDLRLATHDPELATAAKAMGLKVYGLSTDAERA